jgi:hypothetical protein
VRFTRRFTFCEVCEVEGFKQGFEEDI